MILLDTNVLVYALDAESPHHQVSRDVVERVQAGTVNGGLVPQVLLETYAIVTDRRRVANPLAPTDAGRELDVLTQTIPTLHPGPPSLDEWLALCRSRSVSGQDIFDLFLVAQMIEHGIETICTVNTRDFFDFTQIEAVPPGQL